MSDLKTSNANPTRQRSPINASLLFAVALLLVGCGQQDETLVDVRGEVTFCGQPAIAEVLFEPHSSAAQSGGRASTGMTDDQGQFRLLFDGSQPGAKRGKHRVTIRVLRLAGSAGESEPSSTGSESAGTLKSVQLIREVGDQPMQFRFPLSY